MTPGLRAARTATLLACLALLGCASTNNQEPDSSVDCNGEPSLRQPAMLRTAFTLGQRVVQAAEAADAQVALVARVGTNLRRFDVRYSHAGWLWRSSPGARWRIVHQLNVCGTLGTRLYETGPATFFMGELAAPRAAVLLPSAALQQRLYAALSSSLPEALRGERYNFFAHPDSPTDQNSSGWAAELLAAALEPPGAVAARAQAQAALHRHGHEPTRGSLRWWEKLGVRLFYPKVIRLADQPDACEYHVTSADSLIRMLVAADPQARQVTIDLRATN